MKKPQLINILDIEGADRLFRLHQLLAGWNLVVTFIVLFLLYKEMFAQ